MNPMQSLQRAAHASLQALKQAPATADGEQAPPRAPLWRRIWDAKRARYGLLALALLIVAIAFFVARPPAVTVAPVTTGPAVDVVYATGVIEYVRQADIAPIVTAPIQRVLVEEGDQVRAGATLAQLEDGPQRATAAQLSAQASTARLAAQRVQTLYDRGFASRAAWDEARVQLEPAVAAWRASQERLEDYRIKAPFAGAVLRRDAEPGDLATPSRLLFVLADRSALRVDADLDERDLARVEQGQEALIRADAYPDETFSARVSSITPQGDAATRVFRVRLRLGDDALLQAGMTVEANIITGRREDALLIPSAAVRDGAVWVMDGTRAVRREVSLGARGQAHTEVRAGLEANDRVVTDPPEGLGERARVRVRAPS